jgi:hypothetical protein
MPGLLGVRPRLAEFPSPVLIVEPGPDVVEGLPARLELSFDRGQGRDRIDRHVVPASSLSEKYDKGSLSDWRDSTNAV